MPSFDVSQWLLAAVAVLGVLGVIGSQLINTWRESRRAKWEAQREQYSHWRDQRVAAYSNFFAAIQDWQESASRVTLTNVQQPSSPATVALRERCDTARKQARAELARIDLIGSEPVLKQADDVYSILHRWSVDPLDGMLPAANTSNGNRAAIKGLRALDGAVDSLRLAIRAELGIRGGVVEKQEKPELASTA